MSRLARFITGSLLVVVGLIPGSLAPVPSHARIRFASAATGRDRGLVVESIASDSAAARAGLRVGDLLISLEGIPLTTPLNLIAVQDNVTGKTEFQLELLRAATITRLSVPAGRLGLRTRPVMSAVALSAYEQTRRAIEASNSTAVVAGWRMLAEVAQREGDRRVAAWAYARSGDALMEQADWKSAQVAHQQAIQLLEQLGPAAAREQPERTVILQALASCARHLQDSSSARRWYLQAHRCAADGGYDVWAANALTNLGGMLAERGDLEQADETLKRSLALLERRGGDSLFLATTLNNLGAVAISRRNAPAASEYCTRSLALFERLSPASPDLASVLKNLGEAARLAADLETARKQLARALTLAERGGPNSPTSATIRAAMGSLALEVRDLSGAQLHFERALAIQQQGAESTDLVNTLTGLGTVASQRGDTRLAQELLSRALAVAERLEPASLAVATVLINLGNATDHAGDASGPAEAERHYRRALAIAEREAPDSRQHAVALLSLGNIAKRQQSLAEALGFYDRAVAMLETRTADAFPLAGALCNRGALTPPESAGRYFERALTIYETRAPGSLEHATVLHLLGFLALRQGNATEAQTRFERALEMIESQRAEIGSAEARALLTEQHGDKYAGLVRCRLLQNDVPGAFAAVERGRARSLSELLVERKLDFRAEAPIELLERQRQLDLQRTRSYTLLRFLDDRDSRQREELRAQLASLAREQRELTVQMQKASVRFAALEYPAPLDLRQAQAALEPGTLLLYYYLMREETLLFAVTADQVRLRRLSTGEAELRAQVNAFRTLIHERSEVAPAARALYDRLVRPAQELVDGAERILISPDGPLHLLAFAALNAAPASSPNAYSGLGELKPLHFVNSMTVYASLAAQRSEASVQTGLLALGDPDYGTGTGGSGQRGLALRGLALRGLRLEPLPGTRTEVNAIARLYGNTQTLLGKEATERAVLARGRQARLLHFACHGLFDSLDPLGSGLVFSAGEDGEDGVLQAWEILERVRLQADLVVLSACQSGLGRELRSEGIVGLTRAFQYAGARSVMVSLWSVADDSTARLMSSFYEAMKRGVSKDVALQRALAATRHDPRWQHPFYWAPFTLMGDWK